MGSACTDPDDGIGDSDSTGKSIISSIGFFRSQHLDPRK